MPNTAQLSAPSSNVVWVLVANSALFRSTDKGATWDKRSLPAVAGGGWKQVSFIDDRQGWLLHPGVPGTQCSGAGAEIWRTSDGAATWQRVAYVDQQNQTSGLGFAQCKEHISFVDATHGFVGASDGNKSPTIYRTADGGKAWSGSTLPDPPDFKTSGGLALQAGLVKRFGDTLFVDAWGKQGGDIPDRQYVFRSTDGGATWSWLMKIPSRYIAMVTESRWLQLIWPGQSMESINSGQQWHPYASDFSSDTPVGGPQILFADSQVGYAEGRGALQRTVDGGAHWERIATPGTSQPSPVPSPTPTPVALIPITDPGFTCRLPVASPMNGGFVAVPRGAFEPDPGASVVRTYQWIETSTKPVLKGSLMMEMAFDAPFSRWVPASPEVISADGSQYAWIERPAGTPRNLLHVTRVADGSDRTFDAGPPQPQDPDLRGHYASVPIPIAITRSSCCPCAAPVRPRASRTNTFQK